MVTPRRFTATLFQDIHRFANARHQLRLSLQKANHLLFSDVLVVVANLADSGSDAVKRRRGKH